MLALVLLVTLAPEAAQARFLPDTSPEFAEWRRSWPESAEGSCPLTLSLGGAYAFSAEALVVFGDISGGGPGTYRSFLLRSTDGGRSWHETLPPILASSVSDLSFPSEQEGFALVGWVVEGPGTLRLYHTSDAAAHWSVVSEVPKPHTLDFPVGFACSSPRRCQLDLGCVYDSTGPGHAVTTTDGGHTWRATKGQFSRGERVFGRADAKAADGTHWRVRESEDGQYLLVSKTQPHGDAFAEVAALHRNYRRGMAGDLVTCK
jgi:photosystem II stability/assembly factor-like uncharacterized protein